MIKSISLKEYELKQKLPKFKAAGFDGIDLDLLSVGLDKDGWEGRIESIAGILEENGMVCAQVHLPYYGIFESSEIYDEAVELQIKNSFKAMKMLGTKWGAFHPQSASNFGYDRRLAMHDNIEKLKGYLEEAVKYDTGIAVENIPIFPDCPQYNFFSAYPEDHIELIDSLNSDLVKACWDFGHANLMDYNMNDVLRMLGDRIKILHVHNNNKQCDWHVAPSIGKVEWNGAVDTLKEIGYSGPLTLEINLTLVPDERTDSYIKYLGEDAEWLEKKFNS